MPKSLTAVLMLAIVAVIPAAAQPIPSDTVTVGTVTGPRGTIVDVPVFIRDLSGTPLGVDQPPGSRIQSYSLTVNYAPAGSVSAITFARAGITSSLTPSFESSPSGAGTITLLDTFQESTNLIPFTLNSPLPGNQVGVLHVNVSPSAPIGSTITLTLDPTLTQLTDQAGSAGTRETVTNGNLILASGALNVAAAPPPVPALSSTALVLLTLSLAAGSLLRLRRA
jgi:hypothetical protein